MLREKFVTKRQFEVFSRNLDRILNSLKIPSFTVPDDNYDPEGVPGALPTGGVDYQVLYSDAVGDAQWAMPGTRNVFIGEEAAANVTVANREDNVFIGYFAGHGDTVTEFIGERNVIVGSYDESLFTTSQLFGDCSDNVLIGYGAGGAAYASSANVIIGSGINLYTAEGYTLTNCVLLGAATLFGKTASFANSIALGYGANILGDNTCYIGNDDLELVITQGDIRTEGVFYVADDQVVGARVIDADFGNTPDTGDADTDDLIDKMRDALLTHGLIATS